MTLPVLFDSKARLTDAVNYGLTTVLASRQVLAGAGLAGGGNLGSDVTLSVATAGVVDSMLATPYIKADGTRALTGRWAAGDFAIDSQNSTRWVNIVTKGAKGDGKVLSDGVGAVGSTTFTSATANFTSADNTKVIGIALANAITGATNASPIVVTTSGTHGISNGAVVFISGVVGNTAANGYQTVAGVTANTFQLSGTTGNGAYVSGGVVTLGMVTTMTFVNATTVTLGSAATCNGTASPFFYCTDDTAAIQAALTAAGGKGTCYVPPPPIGTFYGVRHAVLAGNSPACLRIPNGTRLTGDGVTSLIREIPPVSGQMFDILSSTNSLYQGLGGSTAPAPSVVDHDIQVDNLAFDGSSIYLHYLPGASEHLAFFTRCQNVRVSNCQFLNFGADGIVYEYSVGCSAVNNASTAVYKSALYASGSENILFQGHDSLGGDGGAITLACSWHCDVLGNDIDGWGKITGVVAGIMLTGDARYNTVSGNTVSRGSALTSNGAIWLSTRTVGGAVVTHGITYGGGADPSGTFPYGARFNTITGNDVVGNNCVGIFIADYCDNNVVVGNEIAASGNIGAILQSCQNNTVRNNKVYNNNTTGIQLQSSAASRPCWRNRVEGNEVSDVRVPEFTTLTGTWATNGTTTVTGTGTFATTEIAAAGAVSPPIPILLPGETAYRNVVNVTSNTSITLDTASNQTASGLTATAPKLSNQITHPAATQTNAIVEFGAQTDLNTIIGNDTTGAVTLLGNTSKVYSHQSGTSGRIQGVGDTTISGTSPIDIGATTVMALVPYANGGTPATFTALRTGSLIINGSVYSNIATNPAQGLFLVIEVQVSTDGGAFVAAPGSFATNTEASRTELPISTVVQVSGGHTYAIKVTGKINAAGTTTYLVFAAQSGLTYRFV